MGWENLAFEDDDVEAFVGEFPRGRETGGAGPNHDDVRGGRHQATGRRRLIYLYVKVSSRSGVHVFETFAVVSTFGCIVIFVALIQANRRSEQNGDK